MRYFFWIFVATVLVLLTACQRQSEERGASSIPQQSGAVAKSHQPGDMSLPLLATGKQHIIAVMLNRAATDYAGLQRRLPSDQATLVGEGYLPFLIPESSPIYYSFDSKTSAAYVSSDGIGCLGPEGDVGPVHLDILVPPPGNYKSAGSGEHKEFVEGELAWVKDSDERSWTWVGGQWAEQGMSNESIAFAMRCKRLLCFIVWNADDYVTEHGQTPDSLKVIEDSVKLQRCDSGWEGINLVSSLGQVATKPGNLFVGLDEGSFWVAANLGPEIEQYHWVEGANGLERTPIYLFY